jgi:hypothetical protein
LLLRCRPSPCALLRKFLARASAPSSIAGEAGPPEVPRSHLVLWIRLWYVLLHQPLQNQHARIAEPLTIVTMVVASIRPLVVVS